MGCQGTGKQRRRRAQNVFVLLLLLIAFSLYGLISCDGKSSCDTAPTVWELMLDDIDLLFAAQMYEIANVGLVELLSIEDQEITVFLPSNEAIQAAFEDDNATALFQQGKIENAIDTTKSLAYALYNMQRGTHVYDLIDDIATVQTVLSDLTLNSSYTIKATSTSARNAVDSEGNSKRVSYMYPIALARGLPEVLESKVACNGAINKVDGLLYPFSIFKDSARNDANSVFGLLEQQLEPLNGSLAPANLNAALQEADAKRQELESSSGGGNSSGSGNGNSSGGGNSSGSGDGNSSGSGDGNSSGSGDGNSSGSNTAIIAACTAGGLAALLVAALAFMYYNRRRRQKLQLQHHRHESSFTRRRTVLKQGAEGPQGDGNASMCDDQKDEFRLPSTTQSMPSVCSRVLSNSAAPPSSDSAPQAQDEQQPEVREGPNAQLPRKTATVRGLAENWLIEESDLQIVRELGHGSFGTVYLGKLHGGLVAVKRVREHERGAYKDEKHMRALAKEVTLMSSVRSPYCLLFLGVCLEPLSCITEYCASGSLYDILHAAKDDEAKRGALTWHRRLRMALDASLGMQYLHSLNILHRDLKSPNLFVDGALRLKVGDFGLSVVVEGGEGQAGSGDTASTTMHWINRRWLAPEVATAFVSPHPPAQPFKRQADVYSFGIVMLELMTFELPWSELSDGQVWFLNSQGKLLPCIPDDDHVVGGAFPGIDHYRQLASDCLSFEPSARPSFSQITDRIRDIYRVLASAHCDSE